ncbi:MAG: cytochrome c [Neisseriaceae bacterium]|nr:cytochrome c [Neisseriaceae bacterium]
MNKIAWVWCAILLGVTACQKQEQATERQPENNQAEIISAEIVDKSSENADKSEEKDAFGAASIYADDTRPPLEIRTAAFKKIQQDMEGMAKVVNGETPYDPDKFLEQVVEFFGDAHEPFHYFEAEMPPEDKRGKSRDTIWTDEDGFFNQQVKFAERSSEFLEATITNDLKKIKPAFANLSQTCKACHDGYKVAD